MKFVYSNWYIVMALLLVAIVALVVVFILMDKKDRVIIKDFVKSLNQDGKEENNKPQQIEANTESVNE